MDVAVRTEPVRVADPFKIRIEGMDCGACATKIESALKRLPGTADIHVNYAHATLSLQLDEERTSRERLEGTIRALGYTPVRLRRRGHACGRWARPGVQQAVVDAG